MTAHDSVPGTSRGLEPARIPQCLSSHRRSTGRHFFAHGRTVDQLAVRFSKVSKRFCLGEAHDSLRDLVSAGMGWLLGRSAERNGHRSFWALRNVNFEVQSGEAVGIIGPNGAGKSTVLKLLAGILRPNEGEIWVSGRLAALIEVGAGFHGDLTGRENIFLNGAILGMSRAEVRSKLETITAFAGLERFLDMPVKRYSSGMYARLGFSIAAHVDPDVLLVDEVLSVGDAVFRLRCLERMHQLVRDGTTLVFVTHHLDQMQSICGRAIVLEDGRATFAGSSREAVGHYLRAMSRAYITRATDLTSDAHGAAGAVELIKLRFLNEVADEVVWVRPGEPIRAELTFRLRRAIPRLIVELNMRATASDNLLSVNSGRDGLSFDGRAGVHTVLLALDAIPVSGGQYFWNVRMWDADRGTTELDAPFRFPLVVDDGGRATGVLTLDHEWSFDDPAASRETVAATTPGESA